MALWIDLGQPGVKLRYVILPPSKAIVPTEVPTGRGAQKVKPPTETPLLVIQGLVKDSPLWNACLEPAMGFEPSPTGKPMLIREYSARNSLRLPVVQTAFPNAKMIDLPDISVVRINLKPGNGGAESAEERALAASMRTASLLGMNALGQRVFEDPARMRFAIDENGNRVDEGSMPPALMLRAEGDNERVCAQGFVMGLSSSVHADAADIKRFTRIIHGRGADLDPVIVERVNRCIKAETLARLIDRHQLAGVAAYVEAQRLYENSAPYVSSNKGGGATPMPAAVMVQEIIRAFGNDDKRNLVYVPKPFDGGLMSLLGPSYVVAADHPIEGSREAAMRTMIPPNVMIFTRGPSDPVAPHKVSVLNTENDLPDTLDNLESDLAFRDERGLTVIIAPSPTSTADRTMADDVGGFEGFAKRISKVYDVQGFVQMAPAMRAKMGIESWLNMLVVGRRLTPSDIAEREVMVGTRQNIDIVRKRVFDWDALREVGNDMLARVHDAAGHTLTANERAALVVDADENRFQLPYGPKSKNGEPELMVPRNLAGPTNEALQALADRVGDIDQYVRNVIGFDEDQYAYLAPEQIDAIALGVSALDQKGGFLLGDQTGAGKGATLAGMISYAWKRGVPVIFVTKQPSLFSDLYRDLKKTGLHDEVRPMLLNADSQMVDQFSDDLRVIAKGTSGADFRKNRMHGLEGFGNPNLIMATYSQFNAGEDSAKSDWAMALAKQAIVIFDESHIAAGETSQLGRVCTAMADDSLGTVYSSATSIKDAEVIRFYQRILPASVTAETVAAAIAVGGESIAETLSMSLARDGRFICRQRDASKLEISVVLDDRNQNRSEKIADQVSRILQGVQRLCGVTNQVGRRLTREQTAKLDAAGGRIKVALNRARGLTDDGRRIPPGEANQAPTHTTRAAQDAVVVDDIVDAPVDQLAVAEAAANAPQMPVDEMGALARLFGGATAEQQQIADANREADEAVMAEVNRRRFLDATPEIEADVRHLMAESVTAEAGGEDAPGSTGDAVRNNEDLELADFGFSAETVSRMEKDLSDLSDLSTQGRLEKDLKEIERMARMVTTQSASFGNFLFFSQRMFNVALQAAFAGQRAVENLQAGMKPLIFLEHTFESALEDAIGESTTVKNEDGTWTVRAPLLKDGLRNLYKSLVEMSHTGVGADGQPTRTVGTVLDSEFMASEEEKQDVASGLEVLESLIEELPEDLFASPIDIIKHTIRKAGFTVVEATGRKYQVTEMNDDGTWTVKVRSKKDKMISEIERAFNFGDADAMVGNKAMSTGMSLHASADFSDQRRRVTSFCQVFSDINDYIQAIGRADRRGQIVDPTIEMLSSGLPAESRVMMAHHGKLRKLLAATTSSRENRFETEDAIDLYNSLGDQSVRDFLQANPGVAVRLGVPLTHFMPAKVNERGWEVEPRVQDLAKYTIARLDLLPVAESRNVFKEMALNFAEVVKVYDEAGTNPLKTNVIDFRKEDFAIISSREDLMPAKLNDDGLVDTVFDEAVSLIAITYKRSYRAPTFEQIMKSVHAGSQRLRVHAAAQKAAGKKPDFIVDREQPTVYGDVVAAEAGSELVRWLPSGLRERVTAMFENSKIMMASSEEARSVIAEKNRTSAAARLARANAANVEDADPPEHTDDDGIDSDFREKAGDQPISPDEVIDRRKTWLLTALAHLVPGSVVSFSELTMFGNASVHSRHTGVITDLIIPPAGRETNLARWRVKIQVPSYFEPMDFTLRDLYRRDFKGNDWWMPANVELPPVWRPFEDLVTENTQQFFDSYAQKRTLYENKRYMLTGNMFRAAALAAQAKLGAGGLMYLDDDKPTRVISVHKGMNRADILKSVPIELDLRTAKEMFTTSWKFLNKPHVEVAFWRDLMTQVLDNRALHAAAEVKASAVSMYWVGAPKTKRSWFVMGDEEDGDGRPGEVNEVVSATDLAEANLLAGFGIRIRNSFDPVKVHEVLTRANAKLADLGCDAIKIQGKTTSASRRYVVTFRNQEGQRESDEVITQKITIVSDMVDDLSPNAHFFTTGSQMRLLAIAANETRASRLRSTRTMREQQEQMAATAARFHVDGAATSLEADAGADTQEGLSGTAAVDPNTLPQPEEVVETERLAA